MLQWRRGLILSGESAVEKITLDGVRGLRMTLSATVHDVLYYMSPIYCQDIINSVLFRFSCIIFDICSYPISAIHFPHELNFMFNNICLFP